MAQWKVDIEKLFSGEYWTNVYYVEADTLALATAHAADIVDLEKATTYDVVTFTKALITPIPNPGNAFATLPINDTGDLVVGTSDLLPLFNVVRVDLIVGEGRPSRKYLRTPVAEDWTTAGSFTTAVLNDINTRYAAPLVALGFVTDESGNPIVGSSVYPKVAMRQLRRGSKRRTTPVLP